MLLGIDTSGAVGVAIARGDLASGDAPEILVVRADERARHHDEVLLELIDTALAEAGGTRADLTGVVVGRGPGPFTGLRVGLVTARTIAAVLGLELHGICSLDALAHEALADAGALLADGGSATDAAPEGERSVGVALDARRREVYWARYRRTAAGELIREAGPAVAPPAEAAQALQGCDQLVGSGAALYPELLAATSPLEHVDAGHLILAAAAARARGEDLASTEPLYLREPDAAKPTARKSALGL